MRFGFHQREHTAAAMRQPFAFNCPAAGILIPPSALADQNPPGLFKIVTIIRAGPLELGPAMMLAVILNSNVAKLATNFCVVGALINNGAMR